MRNTAILSVSHDLSLAIHGDMPQNRDVFDMLSLLPMWVFPRGRACYQKRLAGTAEPVRVARPEAVGLCELKNFRPYKRISPISRATVGIQPEKSRSIPQPRRHRSCHADLREASISGASQLSSALSTGKRRGARFALWAGKQTWSSFSEADSCRFRSITESCPNDFAAYPGYRQFRNRMLLVESFCECHLGPAKSRSGKCAVCGRLSTLPFRDPLQAKSGIATARPSRFVIATTTSRGAAQMSDDISCGNRQVRGCPYCRGVGPLTTSRDGPQPGLQTALRKSWCLETPRFATLPLPLPRSKSGGSRVRAFHCLR